MKDNPQDSLMTPDERKICRQIAATGESPHNLRAQALLSLDTGASQQEVAAQSGLTPNQVKYWLDRFRNNRLTIFPEPLVADRPQPASETEVVTPEVDPVPDEQGQAVVVQAKSEKKQKKKKGKKKKNKKEKKKSINKKGKGKKKKKKEKKTKKAK